MKIKELAEEYLGLKQTEEELHNRVKNIRNVIVKEIQENGTFQVEGKLFTLEKRELFEYDTEITKKIIGEEQYSLVKKVVIDKKKINGLIKGNFITKKQIEPAKIITRSSIALVVK